MGFYNLQLHKLARSCVPEGIKLYTDLHLTGAKGYIIKVYIIYTKKPMFNLIRKTIMAGVGGLGIIRGRTDEMLEEYAKKGERSEAAPAKFVKASLDAFSEWGDGMAERTRELRDSTLETLNIPRKSEVEALKKKVDQLAKEA